MFSQTIVVDMQRSLRHFPTANNLKKLGDGVPPGARYTWHGLSRRVLPYILALASAVASTSDDAVAPSLRTPDGEARPDGSLAKSRRTDMEHSRVLILGAGLAGLSAANMLLSLGFDDFLILEASDRSGGRVRAESTRDGEVDVGAFLARSDRADDPLRRALERLGIRCEPIEHGMAQVFDDGFQLTRCYSQYAIITSMPVDGRRSSTTGRPRPCTTSRRASARR